jgi:hypothetical protein
MDADLAALLALAQSLVDSISHDENGAMVAGQWVGGNGGLLLRETIVAADKLRRAILEFKKETPQ